jgi:hypothetical protein
MEANLDEFRLRVKAITHQFLNITTMPSNDGSNLGVHHLSTGASIEPLGLESLNITPFIWCCQVHLPVGHQRNHREFAFLGRHKHLHFEIHARFIGPYS